MSGVKTDVFVDPASKEKLTHADGVFTSGEGDSYNSEDGIPNFIYPRELHQADQESKDFYEGRADQYDDTLHLTFFTHGLDEDETRNSFIDRLNINENSKVLEVAAGTGRDSVLIGNRLGAQGELHVQDISADMMRRCQEKLKDAPFGRSFCLSNACYLPYPDNYFDATYSFGALGEFSDQKGAIAEMVRVTKPGGKIVMGDESIPVWHRGTHYYNILTKTNPMFAAEVPYDKMPVEARDVTLSWVIGGCFYLFDFAVGEGEPTANFDYPIPGVRGGTYRTRYEGQLEGVSKETKEMAYRAIAKTGQSMHDWLDSVVKEAAKSHLNDE